MNAAQAFIAFLRCEANQAEERGKQLRATAAAIEANSTEGEEPTVTYWTEVSAHILALIVLRVLMNLLPVIL